MLDKFCNPWINMVVFLLKSVLHLILSVTEWVMLSNYINDKNINDIQLSVKEYQSWVPKWCHILVWGSLQLLRKSGRFKSALPILIPWPVRIGWRHSMSWRAWSLMRIFLKKSLWSTAAIFSVPFWFIFFFLVAQLCMEYIMYLIFPRFIHLKLYFFCFIFKKLVILNLKI